MNKKFSTLVAALLASGGLFYAVDAMILPAGDGVAKYVTAVAQTNEAGEFTGYTFASETFNEGTSCIWKMVQVDGGSTYNLTAAASEEATYFLAADAKGNLVMQAKAEGALAFTLDETTGKLTAADGKVLSIADGVLSLQAAGSEVAAAGLFVAAKTPVTEAKTEDGLALGTIVPTKDVVPLTTESQVLNWKAAEPDGNVGVTGLSIQDANAKEYKCTLTSGTGGYYLKFADGKFLKHNGSGTLTIEDIADQQNDSKITFDEGNGYAVKIGEYWLNLDGTEFTAESSKGSQPVYLTEVLASNTTVLNAAKAAEVILFHAEDVSNVSGQSVLKYNAAKPAALNGWENLTSTTLSEAGQGKWSIASTKLLATSGAELVVAENNQAPTLGVTGTAIAFGADYAIKLGENVWLKKTEEGLLCSTEEPTAAEKVYLYSAVGQVIENDNNAPSLVLSTLKTTDGESENVTGTVATVAAKYATPADNLPGLDNATVDANGQVTAVTVDAAGKLTVAAPFYFKNGNTYLSVVVEKDGTFALATGKEEIKDAEPTAAQSASASWKLEGSKLISVASERAGKPVALVAENAPTPKSLSSKAGGEVTFKTAPVKDAPEVTIAAGGAIQFGDIETTGGLYVSTTSMDITDVVNTSDGIVIGGTQKSNEQKLYTSVPSGYALVGVQQADNTMEYLYAAPDGTVSTEAFDGSDYKGYLWKVSETNDNSIAYYYTFTSLQMKGGKAIQWTMSDGTAQLTGGVKYEGQGFTLSHKTGVITADGEASNVPGAKNAVIGFYEAPMALVINDQLDAILNPGFEMTIAIEKDSKDVIENSNIFSGKMYQKETQAGNSTYVLWDNKDAKDAAAKMLVLNKAKISGDNAVGAFAWVTKKEYDKDQDGDKNYVNTFKFMYDLSNPSTDVIAKMMVGDYTVSVLEVDKKFYLTSVIKVTDLTKLPYIKLGSDNVYPVKNLLGKLWNISYADTKVNANADDEAYKLNGIVAVTYDKEGLEYVWNKSTSKWDPTSITSVADYVASSTVAESAPEAQWMVTEANLGTNTFTLTNRENPAVKITGIQLRLRDGNKFEVYITPTAGSASTSESNLKGDNNDIVYLTESVKKDNFQGYMQTTENTLRSNNYFLGQYHAIGGNHNAYFVENHENSHQIGAVADQTKADKWKLHFGMKQDDNKKYTKVDTVYVITAFATLNKDGNGWESDAKKIKRDTLAILPYAFQKVSNREFVTFDATPKFNFYACDETNKDNETQKAKRFALKVKPNGYNFVEISGTEEEAVLSADKMYLANSAENGSLERMQTYAADNNSVMVVEAADASEYHKIAIEWGDTISLFRNENNSQVLYEKRDAKSVVEKDTLSFLNIDNTNQFSVNPAIFADTAYINRWDADGVLNTTYQYLLAVNPSFGLHTENCEIPGHDPIIGGIDTVYGRFLVNLIDTANVYGVNHIHNNWYVNENEAGEKLAKLSFVEGFHTNDTLYVTRQGGETVKIGMTDPAFNVAKFAFRYVDSDAKTFKIQTQFKSYLGDNKSYETAEEFAKAYANGVGTVSDEGYLKWINGTVVVTNGYENGDVFGIEENVKRNPVANEDVTVSSISVIASEGKVIINGAAGKKVTISNVLGQTIASTVLSSDNATISAPAGIVVVAVEGEAAVKAIVK
ncbi:DUF6383 domain-containing protein [Parabacteroides gordonii]|uniref:DUF6383 domain-containing protein n=1 Tax=Parabacteroides gordonii MS-1 = DSM 23371 TaxID=1203610 RepID=A0A0F5JLX3_9BACT|nr:DUF6383 domain-containing protein [Parabacteroides gordonii]KKB58452.1 hypothetical protein HMPREF1536_01329 [Parabacteroides gordonii MS-1 = DSM 23371]MCA5583284.1 DUF6383 domain-containing protein [Parabacteroides gordonii]RGP15970.1 hypothetical protein DXB27_13240 [Parabacteroides gordonii]